MRARAAVVRKPLHQGRRVDVFEDRREAHGVAVQLAAQITTGPVSWRCGALSLETFGISIAPFVCVATQAKCREGTQSMRCSTPSPSPSRALRALRSPDQHGGRECATIVGRVPPPTMIDFAGGERGAQVVSWA